MQSVYSFYSKFKQFCIFSELFAKSNSDNFRMNMLQPIKYCWIARTFLDFNSIPK